MMLVHEQRIAQELSLQERQIRTTIQLLDEGATVPFISRYRKELTGSLDEVQVATIRDRIAQLRDLDKRREAILKSLTELGKLTPVLEESLRAAETMAVLEDIYLPYKPKRKTRASVAKEKGLEPLAMLLLQQEDVDLATIAASFIHEEQGVLNIDDALSGARDIVAEMIAEHAETRAQMRDFFMEQGSFISRVVPGKEMEAIKYKDYFEWSEPVKTAPSHRILAMRRGEKEQMLYLDVEVPEEEAVNLIIQRFIKTVHATASQVQLAIQDGFKRLLKPSMETEVRLITRKRADEEAIRVFAENARQLLLAAPLGSKRILAIDPGFRTGCKVVCLDEQGALLANMTVYPHNGVTKEAEAAHEIRKTVASHHIQAIAIGNGTAGRETEEFVRKLQLPHVTIVMVNESGASIYSASEVAREEFPDYDITVRGAVSIGRRLMDPLAELVKIDPKSIGVGQYQHDVDQSKLQESLADTVISCVNAVGVELNTASKQLLAYVSGLGPALAQSIVTYRNEYGAFKRRADLKKVPRLGDKAFEQAAGFLRIRGAENPLDASAVHPERYALVSKMANDLGSDISSLLTDDQLRKRIPLNRYVSDEVGLPTLHDILTELAKPGLDPREQFETFSFTEGIHTVSDLKVGMKLPGIVTNITNFGAFVDIGVHQDGLVHLSQLANRFVKDPNEVVKVHQQVEVTVMEVDAERNRISLSMKTEEKREKQQHRTPKSGKSNKPVRSETDMAAKLAALKSRFS